MIGLESLPSDPLAIRTKPAAFALCSNVAALVLLAAVGVVAALSFRDYGLGWDDFTQSQYGDLLLSYYRSGLRDRRVFDFVNLYEYGGGFDMVAALAAKLLPFGLFETRRLIGAAVGLIGMALTWRIAHRAGGPFAGFMAVGLIATCPLYLGHMFMNPKDGPFAAAMALLLLAVVRSLQEYPQPRGPTVILFGLGLGLSIGTRVIGLMAGLYIVPALALLLAVEARAQGWQQALGRLTRYLAVLLPGFFLAYAVMALVWPWSVQAPLNPLRAVVYFSSFFEKPWHELFEGALLTVTRMPRSYLPTLLALKLPLLMIILGASGAIGAIVLAIRSAERPQARAVLLLLALAALMPIAVTLAMHPAMYNGIRQFVFILPPLAALGGLAAAWLVPPIRRRGWPALGVAGLLLALGLIRPVIGMVRVHPYEYTWFNGLAGGVRGAQSQFMLDYWGLSFRQAAPGAAGRARQTRRPAAERKLDDRRMRAASAGARCPRSRLRRDLGSQGRGLRDDARRVLLPQARCAGAGGGRARRRHLCARLRHPRAHSDGYPDAAAAVRFGLDFGIRGSAGAGRASCRPVSDRKPSHCARALNCSNATLPLWTSFCIHAIVCGQEHSVWRSDSVYGVRCHTSRRQLPIGRGRDGRTHPRVGLVQNRPRTNLRLACTSQIHGRSHAAGPGTDCAVLGAGFRRLIQ